MNISKTKLREWLHNAYVCGLNDVSEAYIQEWINKKLQEAKNE